MDASDVMTTRVISLGPETPMAEAARVMIDNGISGAPVVENGKLVGIISENDLLRSVESSGERRQSRWLAFGTLSDERAADYLKSRGRAVRDVMTQEVVSVSEATPVAEIARLLESRHIKRVPVVRDNQLVGIVSRANLLRALASRPPAAPAARPDDRKIRDALLAELERADLAKGGAEVNLIVEGGVVHLWGLVRSEIQRKAMLRAAESIEGVRGVDDHLGLAQPLPF
ncbi:MAG: CBS domain-containing protein [Acetobacteraceae bacterium]|nr:CBS domain-containing protein [Acetobacteraceae bacterium]